MGTHPLDDPQLDACLAAALDDPDAPSSFAVDNADRANRAVRKIGAIQAELAAGEALYRLERERLEAWIADERMRAERALDWLTTLTAGYHAVVLDEDPKRKTIRLPAGDLVARKQPDVWTVTAPEDLIAWAEQSGWDEVIRRRDPEVDRAAMKKAFRPAGEGAVTPDGEAVPGVVIVEGETSYSVKPRVVEQ